MRNCLLSLALMMTPMTSVASNPENDPFLWLEEVEGDKALAWVEKQNERSLTLLQSLPEYERFYAKNLAVYDSDERIPTPTIRGEHVYNFWRDAKHERGLWRRATIDSYRAGEPAWDVLLDLDALAEAEGENWVWAGADCLHRSYDRCLVQLSRGGADATVTREFDVASKTFIEDGFQLPEAKGGATYVDRDTVLVSTDFGEGSMTESGYPRLTKRWKRGTPLAEADTLFEGEPGDIGVSSYLVETPERDYAIVQVYPTFFTSRYYLLGEDDELRRLSIPEDAEISGIFHDRLLVSLKSDWVRGGETWPQGALVSVDIDGLLAGEGRVANVVTPDARSSITEVSRTRNMVLVNRMTDVRGRLSAHTLVDGTWQERPIDTPTMGTLSIVSASDDSDFYFFNYEGFLTPDTLYAAEGMATPEAVRSLPAFFDAAPFEVSQHFVTSADGTRVPYFMVARRDLDTNGANPTLIFAYGGFEVPVQPAYSATIGMDWLEAGGVYVVANIRGGGEYGPAWHRAAQRENRQKSYDDFYAVAEDLIARQVTSPRHLGIRGGSGGGLLVGMLFTQRPELFNAVVCQVPLLDMYRYDKLLAGASWVAEYGDPDDPDDWAFLQNFSPYHNLDADTDYPRVFFTTSTRDDRVHPAHARKMVAKMNAMGKPNLYYENTEGGHGGAANNRQQAKVQALIYTYLLNELR